MVSHTSPIHYRTHVCHIKETKKERLTDTVQFQHKRITNPTISHADKVMHAIQQVIRERKTLGGIENSQEARDLQTSAKHKTTSPPVDAKTKKFIQQVCGKFLFLARAVDSTQ